MTPPTDDPTQLGEGFRGYRLSEPFTPVPNLMIDQHIPFLTKAEEKVLIYITRRTLGFQRTADAISLTQMCNGITRKDGTRLDRGTRLHRESVVTAIEGLLEKRLIVAEKITNPNGSAGTTIYRLHIADEAGVAVPGVVEKTDYPQSKKPTRGSRKNRPGVVEKTDPQNKVEIDSKKESPSDIRSGGASPTAARQASLIDDNGQAQEIMAILGEDTSDPQLVSRYRRMAADWAARAEREGIHFDPVGFASDCKAYFTTGKGKRRTVASWPATLNTWYRHAVDGFTPRATPAPKEPSRPRPEDPVPTERFDLAAAKARLQVMRGTNG